MPEFLGPKKSAVMAALMEAGPPYPKAMMQMAMMKDRAPDVEDHQDRADARQKRQDNDRRRAAELVGDSRHDEPPGGVEGRPVMETASIAIPSDSPRCMPRFLISGTESVQAPLIKRSSAKISQ